LNRKDKNIQQGKDSTGHGLPQYDLPELPQLNTPSAECCALLNGAGPGGMAGRFRRAGGAGRIKIQRDRKKGNMGDVLDYVE
jgi:hypothetical protein